MRRFVGVVAAALLTFSVAGISQASGASGASGPTLIYTGDARPDGAVTVTPARRSAAPSTGGLTINPTFDTSITSNPNAADIEAGIQAAIDELESRILNPVTVEIAFVSNTNGLGGAATYYSSVNYGSYRSRLRTLQTRSADDKLALKSLTGGPNNPVNGDTKMKTTLALLRALGKSFRGDHDGHVDSTIYLNTGIMNLLRTGPQDPAKYDLEQVVLHEITEVLGAGGGGSGLASPDDVHALDLFRYRASHHRSFTTDPNVKAYLSIDRGVTNLGYFNQAGGGTDYGDWDSNLNGFPQVQDAFSTPGVALDLDASEWTALDVVGWDLAPAAA